MPQVDPRAVVELLCEEMTEVARAEKLGIARSSYYKWITKLTQSGIIVDKGKLRSGMSVAAAHPRSSRSGAHHAPVMHVWWGDWDVQGALLDGWNMAPSGAPDTAVVIRWKSPEGNHLKSAFVVGPKSQWSSKETERKIHNWQHWQPWSWETIRDLTIAIARVLEVKAIIVPENH